MAGHLVFAGNEVYFDRPKNDCDTVIVNTCGFIGDAKEESVNTLLEQIQAKSRFNHRHARDGRRRKLIAVGCLVERYRDMLIGELPEVDEWYGVREWEKFAADGAAFASRRHMSTPSHYAYLKIAEGCNRSCSYCAIPHIRGSHVSRPIEELVEEAKSLVAQGVKEIIVISQDTTFYGIDLYGRRRIGELLERLANESGAPWIRLHYTYPTSFPVDAIVAIQKHPNICNYIDIPLQHINSRILGSMQRGIDREGTLRLMDTFRKQLPDVCIRTTFIVGYPGETEAEFEELKQFVLDARFDRMGCFAYSPEEATPAESLADTVSEEEKERRVSELMAIQEQISLEKNQTHVGKIFKVIIDRHEGSHYIGRTEYDSPEIDDEVLIPDDIPLHTGRFYQVRITQALENDLLGETVEH